MSSARSLPPLSEWHSAFAAMFDDLQFLIGRPEEYGFVLDQVRAIHDRREWVKERERYEHQHHGAR